MGGRRETDGEIVETEIFFCCVHSCHLKHECLARNAHSHKYELSEQRSEL